MIPPEVVDWTERIVVCFAALGFYQDWKSDCVQGAVELEEVVEEVDS